MYWWVVDSRVYQIVLHSPVFFHILVIAKPFENMFRYKYSPNICDMVLNSFSFISRTSWIVSAAILKTARKVVHSFQLARHALKTLLEAVRQEVKHFTLSLLNSLIPILN
jgi:hypothetical protein